MKYKIGNKVMHKLSDSWCISIITDKIPKSKTGTSRANYRIQVLININKHLEIEEVKYPQFGTITKDNIIKHGYQKFKEEYPEKLI